MPSKKKTRSISCCGSGTPTLNVLLLGIGFFFFSFALNTQGFIEEAVIYSYSHSNGTDIDPHSGYISMGVTYAVMTVACLISVPIVGCLHTRWSMVIGSLCTAVFMAGFFFLNEIFLYSSSVLVGLGSALLWSAQGKYLSLNSSEETSGRHSAIFAASNEMSVTIGGIFLLIIFTAFTDSGTFTKRTIYAIYGVFIVTTIIASAFFLFLPTARSTDNEPPLTVCELTVSTFKLTCDGRMTLLLVVFVYSGIEMSFWSGIYPTCIAFTANIGDEIHAGPTVILALSSICIGLGQLLANTVIYFVASCRDKRALVVALATIIHLLVYAAVPLWFPLRSPMEKTQDASVLGPSVAVALTCAFMMGFADASWNTQISACLLEYFPAKGLQAFSLFNFFQSLATSATFVYGGYLELHYHSLILALLAACACVCFLAAERLQDTRSQSSKE